MCVCILKRRVQSKKVETKKWKSGKGRAGYLMLLRIFYLNAGVREQKNNRLSNGEPFSTTTNSFPRMSLKQIPKRIQQGQSLVSLSSQRVYRPSLIGYRTASSSSSATPTFTKEKDGSDSIKGVVLAFIGGFAGTVLVLSLTSKAEAPSRLLPNKYHTLGLQETRRCSSPSDVGTNIDGDHVFLRIEPPFYIAPPKLTHEQALATAAGDPFWRILSVHMKEPSLQIERPYTPLYVDGVCGPRGKEPIDFMIKKYPDGELGKYAHRLQAGEGVELRGPHVTWQDKQVDNLVLVSRTLNWLWNEMTNSLLA